MKENKMNRLLIRIIEFCHRHRDYNSFDGFIHCHSFDDCCGCFYILNKKKQIMKCNECGKTFTFAEIQQKDPFKKAEFFKKLNYNDA
jgi:hypothetical protein